MVFLSFKNFFEKFIRNINRIAAPLTSILKTIDNEVLSTQVTKNEKNKNKPSDIVEIDSSKIGKNIKTLSIILKLAKSKKSDLLEVKTNFSKTDFLIFKAKNAFIHLRNVFIKAPILKDLNSECHIRI